MVCHDCGTENASMNLVCAYCGFPFPEDRVMAPHHEVLVQLVDVGVDASRQGVDVGRDEADLHRG